MGSLSLLQRIFLNQESNWGLALQVDSLPTELSEAESESEVAQSCPTLWDPMDCSPPGSSVHGDSPGKNTGVGHHAPLQGIFSTQGSNSCLLRLLHWQADIRILNHIIHIGVDLVLRLSIRVNVSFL